MTEVKTADVPETVETRSVLGVRERREALLVSRVALAELTGFTPAVIWRCEDGRPKAEEMAKITEALDTVEKDGLPEHLRKTRIAVPHEPKAKIPSKVELIQRLARVTHLLDEALAAKTAKEMRALVEQAQVAGTGGEAQDEKQDDATEATNDDK
ncbi:helix-turn-helix transcriptional regulator [Micromonospora aurantiaca]|uniref:helix-turn-helix domain-containing protein n=1 Tax=Micromonospora aurantiaca (nom. illeg.) TaxID=47850 RepID=UPI0033FBD070